MTLFQRLLTIVILVEAAAAALAIGWRLTRPVPPDADFTRLDTDTQVQLSSRRSQALSGSPAAWSTLADAYLGNGYFPQAETCYRHVLEREAANIACHYGLALSLSRCGRTSEAIEQFRRFIDVAGSSHADPAWYQIGRCYLREENAVKAESAFKHVSELPEGELQLAKLFVQTGRESEARPILAKLEATYPQSLLVQELAMRAAQQRGRDEEADRYAARLETAAYLFLLNRDVSDLANTRTNAGFEPSFSSPGSPVGPDAAMSNLDQLIHQIDTNPYWLHHRLQLSAAQAAMKAGVPQKAITLLDELFEHSQITPQALIVYGDARLAMQQPAEAQRAWEHSLRLLPSAEAHQRLAELPADHIDKAQRQQHEGLARHFSGLTEYRANQPAAALADLQRAVALMPEYAPSWLYLGKTLLQLGRTQEATDALEKCLEFEPYNGDARTALAARQNPTE